MATLDHIPTPKKHLERTLEYALTWWPVYVLLIPMVAAFVVYWRDPRRDAETILLFAAIVVGLEGVLIAIKHLKTLFERSMARSESLEEGSSHLLRAALDNPDFAGFRGLLDVMFAIQKSGNPLMKRLANDQLSEMAVFLGKFDKTLPFTRGSELITIERHYTSFMNAIGTDGRYVATTLPNFWIEDDTEILQAFFYSQVQNASSGIHIQRVFLLTHGWKENPRVRSLLSKHADISGEYENGGSIETRVLEVMSIDPNEDDFGIYLLNGKPAAIAMGRFTADTLRLQGNDVCFDSVIMDRKYNHFLYRFKRAMPVDEFLKAHIDGGVDSVLVRKIGPVSAPSGDTAL